MKSALTRFSMNHPWLVIGLTLLITAIFAMQFPKVTFDNDPENMLAADEPVRVMHQNVKDEFNLYDFVIVGVVNEEHAQGIFNTKSLTRIHELTLELISLHQVNGLPAVGFGEDEQILDLSNSGMAAILNKAFNQDPNRLFDENGQSAIIAREIISPSVVDNIRQADFGQLAIEYLMEVAPSSDEEAAQIKQFAMDNPLYKGTLISEDGQALAIYVPILAKPYSYNVANLIKHLTQDWPESDQVFITGQPVAQDTFGVEMLVQMATSAPLAGLAIFVLLFVFFRRFVLITAPMVLAMVSVIWAMGLLIGLGFTVHIMSSMIAIFLMPIAVADSVHLLSEFFDTYPKIKDKKETMTHAMDHLFRPMIYTSLTTMAGFGSLALTPIPPVKVFGLHIAFGVGVAWFLTLTLIPAYVQLFVNPKGLESKTQHETFLGRFLKGLGGFSQSKAKLIVMTTVLILAGSFWGMSKIKVNDNPTKWFTSSHPIRVADQVLNSHFGGTYTAYLTLRGSQPTLAEVKSELRTFIEKSSFSGDLKNNLFESLDGRHEDIAQLQDQFLQQARNLDDLSEKLNLLADEINYADPTTVSKTWIRQQIRNVELPNDIMDEFLAGLTEDADLQTLSLDWIDAKIANQPAQQLEVVLADLQAPRFKQPEVLRYIEDFQTHLKQNPLVGKTNSAVDALKKANYELNFQPEKENESFRSVPESVSAVGQVFTQLEGMKKKDSLFHLVSKDYSAMNIWIQLKSGDNVDMETVLNDAESFFQNNPAPVVLQKDWAGLTYLNVVWQDRMVKGMLSSLGSSFIVVLIMMMILFRSPIFGLLSMIPLTVTITFIYGLIGWVGKDYDMPVAVLSALTLGLSVDFAIHFLQRARETQKQTGSWVSSVKSLFQETATAITRNAIIISIGFTPLLFAPLVPYKTVGFFLATIMAVSWFASLIILTALLTFRYRKES